MDPGDRLQAGFELPFQLYGWLVPVFHHSPTLLASDGISYGKNGPPIAGRIPRFQAPLPLYGLRVPDFHHSPTLLASEGIS